MSQPNEPLRRAGDAYRAHVVALPDLIKPKDVLTKRNLAAYWSLGIQTAAALAAELVRDRFVASREMAVGYLYERVLELCFAAHKLTNAEKRQWPGIDFRKETVGETFLINLKASRATSNADISGAVRQKLAAAAALETRRRDSGDDNPLTVGAKTIRAVAAVARGPRSKRTITESGLQIDLLVGDELWSQLGAPSGFGRSIQLEMGRVPIDRLVLDQAIDRAAARVEAAIAQSECVDAQGLIDWPCLLDKFPDA